MSGQSKATVSFSYALKNGLYEYYAFIRGSLLIRPDQEIPLVHENKVHEVNLIFMCSCLDFVTDNKTSLAEARVALHDPTLISRLTARLAKRNLHPSEAIPMSVVLGVELCKKKGLTVCSDEVFNQKLLYLTFDDPNADKNTLPYLKGDLRTLVQKHAIKQVEKNEVDQAITNLAFRALVQKEVDMSKEEAVAKKNISDIGADDIPYLASERFSKLEGDQLLLIPKEKYNLLNKKQMASLPAEKIAQITDAELINSHKFPAAQIPNISVDMVHTLSDDKIQFLSERQVETVLSDAKVPFLSREQLSKLSPERVAKIRSAPLLNASKFPPSQIPHIDDSMVDLLDKEKMRHLSERQIQQVLSTERIPFLEQPALDQLSATQFEQFFKPKRVSELRNPALIAQLKQVQCVDPTLVSALVLPDQFRQLTTLEQIQKVPDEKLTFLTEKSAAHFTEKQWKYVLQFPDKNRFLPHMTEAFKQKFFPKVIEPEKPKTEEPPKKIDPPIPEKNIWKAKWSEMGRYTFFEKLFFVCFVVPYNWLFGSKP